jgi:hypothetical protein
MEVEFSFFYSNANLAAEYSYDAWGRMRNPANWQVYAATAQPTLLFGRGYTGHEHPPLSVGWRSYVRHSVSLCRS